MEDMPRKNELASTPPKSMTFEERMRFLVTLGNSHVQELEVEENPGVVSSFLYNLRRYLNLSGEGHLARTLRDLEKGDLSLLEEPFKEVRQLLENVTAGQFGLGRCELEIKKPPSLKIVLMREGDKIVLALDGDLTEVILYLAYSDFVDQEDIKLLRVGRCQYIAGHEYASGRTYVGGHDRPTFFYKVKFNQNYCDHRCANRAAAERARPPKKVATAMRGRRRAK